MKKLFRILLLTAVISTVAACTPRERTLVILSTNDMHAKIQRFPQLAAAVEACRDTAQLVLLVDAGDRWTGNAFVDKVPAPGKPIVELMNRLGYDVVTVGNHEFDHGQAYLGRMLDSMDFEVVAVNVVSDTATFPQLPPYAIVKRGGVRIGIVGAVTNYEGPGHPAGNKSSFVGLTFPDPQAEAMKYAAELRPKVDVLILLSHMGDDRDMELLNKTQLFDLAIGGHTHVVLDTLVNGTLLTQTGKNLQNVGVSTVRLRGHKVESVDFRVVPLDGYAPDEAFARQVEDYYADAELNKAIGKFALPADKAGLANWMASAIADEADADLGLYHVGGVRLDGIAAGDVSRARVYDLEPFGTRIAVMKMTPEQIRRMIVTKYNEDTREGHRVDLILTTPYTILVDEADRAFDVRFHELREGRVYQIALSDYIFKNYHGLEYADGEILDEEVADVLVDELEDDSPLRPDNRMRQQVLMVIE
ncbi:bifunctional UDP-sugar hydrolase/5'-nucleotidase [uncultured Alistipes sp.]|jgi:5'-nucleotidase|uniref:bifunctional metallophosphatase/5'-nucleotidase n=1 Tax=uncultured Alistipes sp. TaxID=538949 RepID=UPI0025F95076|nr:bifunctional UDP-sugar hydrolase/5'-nucleotidase [uncultured Alistipes sp.]